MPLTLVATPIGHPLDITLRGLQILKNCPVIIGEELKVTRRFLSAMDIEFKEGKTLYELNEHSTPEDIQELLRLCQSHEVALITDCGTPGFCDPGAHLVEACYKNKTPVQSVPGASSLMVFLSLTGIRIDQFYFRGFLPAQNALRLKALKDLKSFKGDVILMDTPYRLQKLLKELEQSYGQKECVLGLSLTQQGERLLRGLPGQILKAMEQEGVPMKSEFVLLMRNN